MAIASLRAGQWMSAVATIDEHVHLGTDNEFNLAAYRYRADASDDATRGSLDVVARANIGDFVNRIVPGSLVRQLPDAEFADCRTFILVSVLGMVTLVVVLPPARFAQLQAVQAIMAERARVRTRVRVVRECDMRTPCARILFSMVCLSGGRTRCLRTDHCEPCTQSPGGLSHTAWRAFRRPGKLPPQPALNALDGDLLEALLDMPRADVEALVAEVPAKERVAVDELLKVVEDLQRMH